jgi:hypothetical protein
MALMDNNVYNNALNNSRILSNNIKNRFLAMPPNHFPQHCELIIDAPELMDIPNLEAFVYFRISSPHSRHSGWIMVGHPELMQMRHEDGNIHMKCQINAHNGDYIMEINIENFEEMLIVLEYCQNLLDYQPAGMFNYVRVPPHMRDLWFIPESLLRQQHLQRLDFDENGNFIGNAQEIDIPIVVGGIGEPWVQEEPNVEPDPNW